MTSEVFTPVELLKRKSVRRFVRNYLLACKRWEDARNPYPDAMYDVLWIVSPSVLEDLYKRGQFNLEEYEALVDLHDRVHSFDEP